MCTYYYIRYIKFQCRCSMFPRVLVCVSTTKSRTQASIIILKIHKGSSFSIRDAARAQLLNMSDSHAILPFLPIKFIFFLFVFYIFNVLSLQLSIIDSIIVCRCCCCCFFVCRAKINNTFEFYLPSYACISGALLLFYSIIHTYTSIMSS